MSKDIAFDNETRTKMAAGVNKLADAVRVTIGPKGRYVAMQKEHEKPNVSNDGATVAANVDLEDPIENMGMKIVREAAIAANNDAGDGTTTATILSDAIVSEGVRCVISGSDPAGAAPRHPARCRVVATRFSRTPSRLPRVSRSPRSRRFPQATARSARRSRRLWMPSAVTASSRSRSLRTSASR